MSFASTPKSVPVLWIIGVAGALLLSTTLLNGPLFSIRKLDPLTGNVIFNTARSANGQGQNQKFALKSFDADQFVTQQWDSDVLPALQKNTVNLDEVLEAISQNPSAAALRYALPREGGKNFIVSGQAFVHQVDSKSPMGLLTLEFPDNPALAKQKIQVLTGPLVISTALRDALPSMSLNSFTNQTQYADVAAALNKHALSLAFANAPPASLTGKTIAFTGVFSLQSPSTIRIVPIALTVKE